MRGRCCGVRGEFARAAAVSAVCGPGTVSTVGAGTVVGDADTRTRLGRRSRRAARRALARPITTHIYTRHVNKVS